MRKPIELIDWSEQYPNESSLQIAVRQSTYCLCGKQKEIGEANCGADYHLVSDEK
jgi:hypothetical protein